MNNAILNSSISLYPKFRRLRLTDRAWLQAFLKQFPPYSDFNFVSLYSYDTEEDAQISLLHSNLVVKFRHYLTNEPFYTFIGEKMILETADELLQRAQAENVLSELQLIPEFMIQKEPRLRNIFSVREDNANHDYLLHLPQIATLSGTKFANKRNLVNRFNKEYPNASIRTLILSEKEEHERILEVFTRWVEGKNASHEDNEHEKKAIKRLLSASEDLNVIAVGVVINDQLKGYAIGEKVDEDFGIFHFVKGDPAIRGIGEILYKSIAIELMKLGCNFMNFEQDFGFPGLRMAKEQWNPISVLKKYTIQKLSDTDKNNSGSDEEHSD